MRDWLPLIAGYVIIVAAVIAVRAAPNSVVGSELRRRYGVAPSGERGISTRRDHAKSAGLAAAVALGMLVTCVGAVNVMDRFPNGSRGNLVAATYMFGAFLLAGVAMLAAIVALWKAVFWHAELPDTPEHRRAFADAIDHFLDGTITEAERREFLDVRYRQREMESIRRSTIKLVRQHQGRLPDNFRDQIKELVAHIRATAG